MFFNMLIDGVIVDKQAQKSFTIYPQIIISVNCNMRDLKVSPYLESRFDIFKISACNKNFIPLNA
jgi:hypothetical protein